MQVVPVYPLSHAHCADEHVVLVNRSVQSEVDVHTKPTTAEKVKRESIVYNNGTSFLFSLNLEVKIIIVSNIESIHLRTYSFKTI